MQTPARDVLLKRPPEEPSGQSPNRKRLRLSLLPGSSAAYEAESTVVRHRPFLHFCLASKVIVCKNRNHPFFPADAQFTTFSNNPGAIVADKTRFIPLLEANPFQYLFLHPRRWGKSTFLNMLAAYYDVKTKDSFEEVFGQLDIGKAPTESRNSHLILLFDFSTITPFGSREEVMQRIFLNISGTLRHFLLKYRDILDDASPEEYITPGGVADSLTNVLASSLKLVFFHSTE